jgi:hypothetical protein
MISAPTAPRSDPLLTPDGIFVLHLRSDSAPAGEHVVGRIEHLKSGDSEAFASLAALLRFIDRYVSHDRPPAGRPQPQRRTTCDQ